MAGTSKRLIFSPLSIEFALSVASLTFALYNLFRNRETINVQK